MPDAREINFDGLVGPTHNYAGLSVGNLASVQHKALTSNPREAALQGLRKMKFLADLGLDQGIIPPQERPSIQALRALGFSGNDDAAILEKTAREAPKLLSSCSSASSMWTANAATFSPSADSLDGRAHFTPANLVSKLHRSIEAGQTAKILKAIFNNDAYFVHHPPLNGGTALRDEGAANHTRLCASFGQPGLQLFVYGASVQQPEADRPTQFPARQSLEASRTIGRLHQLPQNAVVFARQNPKAIDAGVFHNDVISVGNRNFFLCHQNAFADQEMVLEKLQGQFEAVCGQSLSCCQVSEEEVSVEIAVATYLFNSQIVSKPDDSMAIIAPIESQRDPQVSDFFRRLTDNPDFPVKEVHFFDLRQSMSNGGGPACLRQRVVLTSEERDSLPKEIFLTESNYPVLVDWVNRHYRDSLSQNDLADPRLLEEGRVALDELCSILEIGPIYPFQA